MKLPSRQTLVWTVPILVVIGAIIWYWMLPFAEVTTVKRGTAIAAVYGTVRIEAAFVVRVRAQNAGFIHLAERFSAGRGAIGNQCH